MCVKTEFTFHWLSLKSMVYTLLQNKLDSELDPVDLGAALDPCREPLQPCGILQFDICN